MNQQKVEYKNKRLLQTLTCNINLGFIKFIDQTFGNIECVNCASLSKYSDGTALSSTQCNCIDNAVFINIGDLVDYPYYMGCSCAPNNYRNGSFCFSCSQIADSTDSVNCYSCT
jgi:hypothetical protein